MKIKTYNKFKSLLTKACDKQIKAGGKIACGHFKVGEDYCPIGLATGEPADRSYLQAMNRKLGENVQDQDYWDFIDGFDGNEPDDEPDERQSTKLLFKLGRKFRELYITAIERE